MTYDNEIDIITSNEEHEIKITDGFTIVHYDCARW